MNERTERSEGHERMPKVSTGMSEGMPKVSTGMSERMPKVSRA